MTVHYSGYLPNGEIFDSSRDRGKPFKFKIGGEQVIPGLDAGVSQLSIGERAKLVIPSKMAYGISCSCMWIYDLDSLGERGFPGLIPSNSDLVFDLELITFN